MLIIKKYNILYCRCLEAKTNYCKKDKYLTIQNERKKIKINYTLTRFEADHF